MTAGADPFEPGPKLLAALHARFGPDAARGIFVGGFDFAHVEVLVRTRATLPLDSLESSLLHALAAYGPCDIGRIAAVLHLSPTVVLTLLRPAERAGRVVRSPSARPAEPAWSLTELGKKSLEARAHESDRFHREHFVVRRGVAFPDPFAKVVAPPAPAAECGPIVNLVDAVRRALGMKSAPGLSADWDWPDELPVRDRWRAVPVVRGERRPLLLVPNKSTVDAYYIAADDAGPKAFQLPTEFAHQVFPELNEQPDEPALHEAWAGWLKARSIPAADFTPVRPEWVGDSARAVVSAALHDWLHAHRPDALAGEIVLAFGTGPVRHVARLHIRRGES